MEHRILIQGNERKFLTAYYSREFCFTAFRQQKKRNHFLVILFSAKKLKSFYFLGELLKILKSEDYY